MPVDKCIGKEIEYLLDNGVITYSCCCGHGEDEPTCLVDIRSEYVCNKLGYELKEFTDMHTNDGVYEIKLKQIY